MHKIREILEEAYTVMVSSKESVPLVDGLIDEAILADKTKKLMSFGMHYLRTDFVEVEKKFPKNDEVEVDLHMDFVVIKGDEYRRLMKLMDKYE